jgi:predicted metal-dependent hydrolase
MSTNLVIRRLPFEFDDDVPFQWQPSNPEFGVLMNSVAIIAIAFEKYVVSAVRAAIPRITDPAVAEEAQAFLTQEAQHAAAHRRHMRALATRYPGVGLVRDQAIAEYDRLFEAHPLDYHLAYIADLEATFTPIFKLWLDRHEILFEPGDDRVASLFLWHFVEEVEHRSSALIIYSHVVGRPSYRLKMSRSVFDHVSKVAQRTMAGFGEHVPQADLGIDISVLDPVGIWRREIVARMPRFRAAGGVNTPMFGDATGSDIAKTAMRLAFSQAPRHDPQHQPLPTFADQWLDRYASGADVTRWYTGASNQKGRPDQLAD